MPTLALAVQLIASMMSEEDPSTSGRVDSLTDLIRSPGGKSLQPATRDSLAATRDSDRTTITTRKSDMGPVPRRFVVLVCIITIAGLLLRLPSFRSSLYGDELSTYFIVVGHSLSRVLRLVESNQETSPPLYFIVAWATKGLLSNPGESIRLISLVTGTAAIPLTFLLGLWTVGRRAAVVGAACLALSPTMIFYSSDARPFMLALFFALLSTLALLRSLEKGRLGWWTAYAVFTCAAAYTHYSVVFLLFTQLAWAMWTQPRARRPLITANVAAALGYIPWINGFREDLHAPNFISVLEPFTLHTVETNLESVWIVPGILTVVLVCTGLTIGVVGLILKAKGTRSRWHLPSGAVLVTLLAITPTVLIILYSWIRVDIFDNALLIYSWPALALVIGALVTSPTRPLWMAAVALTVGAYAIGGAKTLGSAGQRPNIDAVVAYIDQVGTSGDPIVCQCFAAVPLTELDVALADSGSSRHYPVLRLGLIPKAEALTFLSGPNPQPQSFPPPPPPQAIARQAVTLSRHGTIFFVTGTLLASLPAPLAKTHDPMAEARAFIKALPTRFHIVGHMTYPGMSGSSLQSVFVIRDTR